MFKRIIVIGFLFASLLEAKNIVVVTDLSQGITSKEGMEVMNIINPKKSPIYKENDKFYGYVFTEKGRKKTIGTYVDKGTSKKKWRNFYKKQYETYFKVVKQGVKKTLVQEKVEKDIVFLIDSSGSMKKNNIIKNVKRALDNLVSEKGEKVNVAIVTFDGHESFDNPENARILLDFTNNHKDILNTIDSLQFSNFNTFLGSGLELSFDLLEKRNTKSKRIFIVSDGDNIYDETHALNQMKRANNIEVQPIAVGGASISTLKNFSTSGNVYDATRGDMKTLVVERSNYQDTLFQNFAALTNSVFKKNKSNDDVLIVYSTMMEVSDLYDFYMIPNLSDGPFYRELKQKLQDEHLRIDFNGMKVYVRLLGNPSAKKENELRIFWERFIKDHNGKVSNINKEVLTIEEMDY